MTGTRSVIALAPEPPEVTAARRRFVMVSVVLAMTAGAVAGLVSGRSVW